MKPIQSAGIFILCLFPGSLWAMDEAECMRHSFGDGYKVFEDAQGNLELTFKSKLKSGAMGLDTQPWNICGYEIRDPSVFYTQFDDVYSDNSETFFTAKIEKTHLQDLDSYVAKNFNVHGFSKETDSAEASAGARVSFYYAPKGIGASSDEAFPICQSHDFASLSQLAMGRIFRVAEGYFKLKEAEINSHAFGVRKHIYKQVVPARPVCAYRLTFEKVM